MTWKSSAVECRIKSSVLAFGITLSLLSPLGCRKDPPEDGSQHLNSSHAKVDAVSGLRAAIEARDWERAEQLARAAMIARPNDADVLTNAAIASANRGKRVEAARLLVDAARVSGYSSEGDRVENAVLALLDVGRLFDAIELIEQTLQRDPNASRYRRMLVGFLSEAQLTGDLDTHMNHLMRDRQVDLPLLLATTETSTRRFSMKTISMLIEKNRDDLRPRLAIAFSKLRQRSAGESELELRKIIQIHPDFAPAHALLGRALVDQGKLGEIPDWHREAPETTSNYPGYWIALGAAATATGQQAGAVRALAEGTRRAPNDSAVWTRLGGALQTLIQESQETADQQPQDENLVRIAEAVDRRTSDLLELREYFSQFLNEKDRRQSVAVAIASELMDLGRNWEAEAWLRSAQSLEGPPAKDLVSLHQEVIERIAQDRHWQSRQGHGELDFELSQFPLPRIEGIDASDAADVADRSVDSSLFRVVRLADEASQRSLQFYGDIGRRVPGPLVPIHQTLGCGGGVIDLDHDGRHDLVFAAAGGSIRGRDSRPGAVFRNVGSSFREVSSESGFVDRGFGHGIAVGDYNDDGFPDILVLNLGRNTLYRNNGDGTFKDVSLDLPDDGGGGDWSTCAAIVDVNNDGYNDFVIVNYCDADQPLEEPCFHHGGQEMNCYPRRYLAGRDQFIQLTDDGRFVDASDDWAAQSVPGRGLGVVAGRLDGEQLAVFVVNDASVNHYYRWNDDRASYPLAETAVASGLAVDAQSLHQGSMGIASSDFDTDGDLDFYVTGFAQEYNVLYEQRTRGIWVDQTAGHDLIASTLDTVGFGTEAIDFDNDGVDELIVSNGHVGDFGTDAPPYAQLVQVFRRTSSGSYTSLDTGDDGYLRSPHIGRALFTCDVDRDGRSDVVVTHMTEPVALLVNHSSRDHRQITFHLVDTKQTRDAIGAVIDFQIEIGSVKQSRRLFRLAGHGYLCSNRPEICGGTGPAMTARNIEVTWPDGGKQRLGDLDTNAEYLIVRGQEAAFLRHRYDEP